VAGRLVTVLDRIAAQSWDAAARADTRTLATAGRHILDTMACVVSGASHPMTRRWLAVLPQTTNCGYAATAIAGRWDLATVVSVESTIAHVDEFDPLHGAASVAPGAVVVPAALTLAADIGASGEQVARAVIAGYEAVIEAALEFGGPALYSAGWWPTSLFGALGSAAAAAYLLGLGMPSTATALAHAATVLGGLLSADSLGDGHYLLCGRASAHGVWSALAARTGLTASTSLLDGPARTALGQRQRVSAESPGPHILATAIKNWPCARPLHCALAALQELADEGVVLSPGAAVNIALPSAALHFVTTNTSPHSPVEAAASAAVAVAGVLAGRAADPAWYRGGATADLSKMTVSIHADPQLDSLFPNRWGAEVTVDADSRRSRRRVLVAPGDPDRPLPDEVLLDKAAALIGVPKTASILHRLLRIAEEPDAAAVRADLQQPCSAT
jgi:2-methylcitrate dehydratase PrpD